MPTGASVDAGFARDMQAHHAQAVEMSVLVRDRTDDQDVRWLALGIGLTQQQGQMLGWLEIWGPPQSAPSPMAWMADDGHGSMSGAEAQPMPGFATPEQMDRLAAADGQDADRLYLALMIPHHEGGLQMAQVAADRAGQPTVRALAEAIRLPGGRDHGAPDDARRTRRSSAGPVRSSGAPGSVWHVSDRQAGR